MLFALTADQTRDAESRAVADGLATLGDLMQRAGVALAAETSRRVPLGIVAVVCGPGNNGGDGWVAARELHRSGRDVRVFSLRDPGDLPPEASAAAAAAIADGVAWHLFDDMDDLVDAAAVIDALFGFGFRGPARDASAGAIAAMNNSGVTVISADVPSGIDSDTGQVIGPAVKAHATVTFSAHKPGLLIYPGAACAGEVVVADIGLPDSLTRVPAALELPDLADLRVHFPVPMPEDHKGSRGRVAVVAGSLDYPGAAILAAQGALRMGAGYVVIVVPERIADIVRIALPNAIVRAVADLADGSMASVDAVMEAIADADAVVVGPGLTRAPRVSEIVRALLADVTVPLVLDADGLNVVGADADVLSRRTAPLLLTPHPGEAARLLATTPEAVQADRVGAAVAVAAVGQVCVLKGARSVIAGEHRRALVLSGNAALARAGSGDVLSGMLGALLAQGTPPFEAAVLGAHLHGSAADYGAARLTQTCFTAADIVEFLPDAVREVLGG